MHHDITVSTYLMIALGSALGGTGRHWASTWISSHGSRDFPWGTLFVNTLGSWLVGLAAAGIMAPGGLPDAARWGLVVGICGSFTTVSSFSLQTLVLAKQRRLALALVNSVATVGGCLSLVWLGLITGRLLWGTP